MRKVRRKEVTTILPEVTRWGHGRAGTESKQSGSSVHIFNYYALFPLFWISYLFLSNIYLRNTLCPCKTFWEYGEEGDPATDYKDISTQGEWRTCVVLHDICGVFSLPSGTSDFSLMIGEQLRCWEDWWLILQGEQSCWSAFPLGDLAYGCVGVKNKAPSRLLNKHLLSICKFKIFYWELLETYRLLLLNIIIKRHQCKLHGQKTV